MGVESDLLIYKTLASCVGGWHIADASHTLRKGLTSSQHTRIVFPVCRELLQGEAAKTSELKAFDDVNQSDDFFIIFNYYYRFIYVQKYLCAAPFGLDTSLKF